MPAQLNELKIQDVAIKLHRAGSGPKLLFLHGAGGVPQWLPFFDPLTGGHKASGKPFMSIRDLRGGGDGRGYNGGDMAEEAAEQRRDQQPQPDRLSAEQDHWRSEATLYQQCCQKDDARATAADDSAGDDAGGH
jgi:hypothetical protein